MIREWPTEPIKCLLCYGLGTIIDRFKQNERVRCGCQEETWEDKFCANLVRIGAARPIIVNGVKRFELTELWRQAGQTGEMKEQHE